MSTIAAPAPRPTLLRRPRVLATPGRAPAYSDIAMTAMSGKLRNLATAIKTLERKAAAGIVGAPQQLAHYKVQLRTMLADPRVAVRGRPKSVSLSVWDSFQQSVRLARAAVAGVKPVAVSPLPTAHVPTQVSVQPVPPVAAVPGVKPIVTRAPVTAVQPPPAAPVVPPTVTAAEAAAIDPAVVTEITEYLAILVAEAESEEPEVSRSAQGEIVDVLMMEDVAPLLVADQAPMGVTADAWETFLGVLEEAEAHAEDTATPIGLGPEELPADVAEPLVESILEAQAAEEAAAAAPPTPAPPVQPPVTRTPPETTPAPTAQPEVSLVDRTKASMREHPVAWGVGGLVGAFAIWKGVSYVRGERG
jgi:hypothetical protein